MNPVANVGAVRKREIPHELLGASHERIREWARNELSGIEANLDRDTITRIQAGELKEVTLRPRKAGFFAPDGQFIEAYDYQPAFGEDLTHAEEQWAQEEADRGWADTESSRFNRSAVESSGGSARAMWEHGKRIHEYSEKSGRPIWTLLTLLAKRAGPGGYAKYTHQTCVYFYRWKPDLTPNDPIMGWSWQLVDAVMRFSSLDEVRENAVRALTETQLGHLPANQLAQVLGIRNRKVESHLPEADRQELEAVRDSIASGILPTSETIPRLLAILERLSSVKAGESTPSSPVPAREINDDS